MNLTDNVFDVKETAETGGSVRAWKVRQRQPQRLEDWSDLICLSHSGEKIFRYFNYTSCTSH